MIKKVLCGAGLLGVALLLGGAVYVGSTIVKCDSSMSKIYELPLPAVTASRDPAVIARGKHLTEAAGACATA